MNFGVPINLNKNELQNPRLHNLAANPASPVKGQFFYNTNDDTVAVFNGSAWQVFATLTSILTARLDQFATPTGDINMGGRKHTNMGVGSADSDGVTWGQVKGLIDNLKWKDAVRMASTTALTKTGLQTVDGVTGVVGNRVADLSNTSGAGIWIMDTGAWARASDADTAAEVLGMTFSVLEGSTNDNKVFNLSTNAPITLGTTALTFAQIGSLGVTYTAGTGISIAGNVISVDATVARKVSQLIGNGSLTSITVTHSLGTKAVTVALRKVSTDELWIADVTAATTAAVTLAFTVAPTSNEFEVTVIG